MIYTARGFGEGNSAAIQSAAVVLLSEKKDVRMIAVAVTSLVWSHLSVAFFTRGIPQQMDSTMLSPIARCPALCLVRVPVKYHTLCFVLICGIV